MNPLPVLNTQPPEGLSQHQTALEVVDVWYTMQGEGPFTGRPAVFVRLAGCNLQCPHCDTDYTTGRRFVSAIDLVDEVYDKWRQVPGFSILPFGYFQPLVVITGGEPFRQRIGEFVRRLLLVDNFLVQIETNGTLFPTESFPFYASCLRVVCSPKAMVHKDLVKHVDCFKYVLSADNLDDDGLPRTTLGGTAPVFRPLLSGPGAVQLHRVYVQAEDHPDHTVAKANLDATVASAMKHGYTLSLQTHKLLGLK